MLSFRPLKPDLMDDLGACLKGSWGATCWCMFPRLTREQMQGQGGRRRRAAMAKLASRRRAPGLLAFEGQEVAGWVAIAPRTELGRIERGRATPRVDDVDVWVIPCITVRPSARGRGVGLALIRAAVAYARKHGAPAVEAYPRAGSARTKDDNAFIGTEPLFRRAGFKVLKKGPFRATMRITARITASPGRAGPSTRGKRG